MLAGPERTECEQRKRKMRPLHRWDLWYQSGTLIGYALPRGWFEFETRKKQEEKTRRKGREKSSWTRVGKGKKLDEEAFRSSLRRSAVAAFAAVAAAAAVVPQFEGKSAH
ncbi:hypothetical protein M0802_005612 [Mischocyttarus mexicanus]|nr:hypothetical protein M0802_005612 [Mischocyttarus mexicanus]